MELKHPHTLLLVDDEASILKSLSRLFRKEPYTIITAGSGHEALEKLAQAAESVSLIISDQRMPKMNGAEFLEKARVLSPNAMRFVLTGYADLDAVVDAVNKGRIHRYISKPWNDEDILAQVRSALSQVELRLENIRLSELTERQNAQLMELNKTLEETVSKRTWALQYQNKILQAANQGLEKSLMDTIRLLLALVESSNPKLGRYTQAVARLARALANDAELDESEGNKIEMAGLVHDIGLLGMAESFIEKDPKVMTAEEMETFRQHPTIAFVSLSSVERLKEVGEIVLAHHENVDGSGFPRGLRAEGMPIGAKILALAADYQKIIHLWPQNVQRFLAQARRYLDAASIAALDVNDEALRKVVAERIIEAGIQQRYDLAMANLLLKRLAGQRPHQEVMRLPVQALKEGMLLMQDLRLDNGRLLLGRGTLLNERCVQSIRSMGERELLKGTIEVSEPNPHAIDTGEVA